MFCYQFQISVSIMNLYIIMWGFSIIFLIIVKKYRFLLIVKSREYFLGSSFITNMKKSFLLKCIFEKLI